MASSGAFMGYIVLIGYLFVTVLFSAAQPTLPRMLIYFVFWSLLPTVFVLWVARVRRRNRLAKRAPLPVPTVASEEDV